jgi:hypothetical protein
MVGLTIKAAKRKRKQEGRINVTLSSSPLSIIKATE